MLDCYWLFSEFFEDCNAGLHWLKRSCHYCVFRLGRSIQRLSGKSSSKKQPLRSTAAGTSRK